jgi:hypothetical protein
LLATLSANAAFDFGPWPTGTAPTEVGQRVTDNFLPHVSNSPPAGFRSQLCVLCILCSVFFAPLTAQAHGLTFTRIEAIFAQAMTDDEIRAAAEYYGAIKWTPWKSNAVRASVSSPTSRWAASSAAKN